MLYRERFYRQFWFYTLAIFLFLLVFLHPEVAFTAQLTLDWDDNANDETGFRIERRTEGSSDYFWLVSLGPDTISYVDTSVTPGSTYCYRVQAFNPGGLSAYSNEACAPVTGVLVGFESPSAGQAVAGISTIRGWAFSSLAGIKVQKVELFVDGNVVGELPCCSPRGDVQGAFPQFPVDNTANSGWGTGVNWSELPPGPHSVFIKATSTNGDTTLSDVRTVTVVRLGASAFIDAFSLSRASVEIAGQDLIVKNIVVRDKDTQQQSEVTATFNWLTNAQGFSLTQAFTTNASLASLPQSLVAQALAKARQWWQAHLFGPNPAYAASIFAALESPDSGQSLFGINVLRGWAFASDPATIRAIRLFIDNTPLTLISCCSTRQDVAAFYGNGAGNSGWGITANYANLPAGTHTIAIEFEASDGTVHTLFQQITVVKVEGVAYIDLVDLADASARIEGDEIVVSGVRIRDAASQQTRTVQLRLRWSLNSQSLGIVAVN